MNTSPVPTSDSEEDKLRRKSSVRFHWIVSITGKNLTKTYLVQRKHDLL